MSNPYLPPASDHQLQLEPRNRLAFVCLWLVVATFGGMLLVPADGLSILFALVLSLICFAMGVIASTPLSPAVKVTGILVCFSIAVYIAVVGFALERYLLTAVFAGVNALLGALVYRSVQVRRRRVLTVLLTTFTFSILLGPLGCLVIPMLAVAWTAKRAVGNSEMISQ